MRRRRKRRSRESEELFMRYNPITNHRRRYIIINIGGKYKVYEYDEFFNQLHSRKHSRFNRIPLCKSINANLPLYYPIKEYALSAAHAVQWDLALFILSQSIKVVMIIIMRI